MPLTEDRLISVLKKVGITTQTDLKDVEKKLISVMVKLAEDITSTADRRHAEVMDRFDEIELNTVKRNEFEALKRKVDQLHNSIIASN